MMRRNMLTEDRAGRERGDPEMAYTAGRLLPFLLLLVTGATVAAADPAVPAPAATEATKDAATPEPADAVDAAKPGDEPISAKIKQTSPQPMGQPAGSDQQADEVQRRVEAVTKKMLQAKDRLAGKQTDQATQDLQKQILADLDELLKSPPSSSSPSSGGSGGGKSPPRSSSQQNNSQNDQGKGKSTQQQQAGGDDQNGEQETSKDGNMDPANGAAPQSGNESEGKQADEAEERSRAARQGKVVALPRRRMEVDVWGHLPEKVREKLLSAYSERMVPQYEEMVQQFYRSLADGAAPPATQP